jgi:hypothetical protein
MRTLFRKLLASTALLTLLLAMGPAHAQWQQVVSAHIELGVRSKFGEEPYTALFTVKRQERSKKATEVVYTASINVEADEFGKVVFPDDFRDKGGQQASPPEGTYTWTCTVEGEVVLSGKFVMP